MERAPPLSRDNAIHPLSIVHSRHRQRGALHWQAKESGCSRGAPGLSKKPSHDFIGSGASEFPGPCHALCGFAGAGRARRSRCATESVKRGELSCHPEPAARGEGPHNCNPRVRFKEKAQIAAERSLFVLRRIGMTTREGSASGSRGCLPGDRKGMTRSKRANGGGRRRGYT